MDLTDIFIWYKLGLYIAGDYENIKSLEKVKTNHFIRNSTIDDGERFIWILFW